MSDITACQALKRQAAHSMIEVVLRAFAFCQKAENENRPLRNRLELINAEARIEISGIDKFLKVKSDNSQHRNRPNVRNEETIKYITGND